MPIVHDTTLTADEREAIARLLMFAGYGHEARRLLAALEAAESFVTDELRKEREHNGRLQREVESAVNWRSHFERYGQHLKHCRCRDSDGWVAGKYGQIHKPDALLCDCGLTGVLALLRATP